MALNSPSKLPTSTVSNTMRAAALAALALTGACENSPSNPTTSPTPAQNAVPVQPACGFVTQYAPDLPNCSNQTRLANNGSCEIPLCVSELIDQVTSDRLQPPLRPGEAEAATRRQIRGYCAELELATRNGRFHLIAERGGYCAPIPTNQLN